jgi:ribosomal 30S subunit maturation factor RimM
VSVIPLVEAPGTVFQPQAEVYVVDEARRVLAGPLLVARRRAYHREWLIGFAGVTSRDAVEGWRNQLLAVPDTDAGA